MRTTRTILAAAALLCAAPAHAQTAAAIQEMESYSTGGNAMLDAHREATQRSIDLTVKALQAGDYRKARNHAQAVTRKDPDRVEAWLLLGEAQMGLQDWKNARTAYARAVRLWPSHPEARAGLGVSLARLGDPRATTHLAWLSEKLAACGSTCPNAAQLTRLKAEVETALAATAAAGS